MALDYKLSQQFMNLGVDPIALAAELASGGTITGPTTFLGLTKLGNGSNVLIGQTTDTGVYGLDVKTASGGTANPFIRFQVPGSGQQNVQITANAALPPPLSNTLLSVQAADGQVGRIVMEAAASSNAFNFRRVQGTMASPTATASGTIGVIGYFGYDGTAFSASQASITGGTASTWTTSAHPTFISFSTTPTTTTTQVEVARVSTGGNLLVGTTTDPSTTATIVATQFNVTSAGPTWTQGSAAPVSTQPKGSIYSQTGAGTSLYVSDGGGTWIAESTGNLLAPQLLTSSSGNFTVPAGVTRLRGTMTGAGGGGGGVSAAAATGSAAYCGTIVEFVMVVTPGQVIAYTNGTGGAQGANTGTNGGTGGDTTFGTFIAKGGAGGVGSTSGNAAVPSSALGIAQINGSVVVPTATAFMLSLPAINAGAVGAAGVGGASRGSWGVSIPGTNGSATDATGYGTGGSGAGSTVSTAGTGGLGAPGAIFLY